MERFLKSFTEVDLKKKKKNIRKNLHITKIILTFAQRKVNNN